MERKTTRAKENLTLWNIRQIIYQDVFFTQKWKHKELPRWIRTERTKRNNFVNTFYDFSEASSHRLHSLGILQIYDSKKRCSASIIYVHDIKRTRSCTIHPKFSVIFLFSLRTVQLEAYFPEIPSRVSIL